MLINNLIVKKLTKEPSQKQINTILDLYNNKNFEKAENYVLKITQEFPKFYFGWKALGVILKQNGKITDAIIANNKAIEINPTDPETYYNQGNTFYKIRKLDESKTSFEKAIELNSNYPEAYNNLGTILRELGKLDESEKTLRKAIELNSNYPEAYNNLGIVFRQLGKLEEAQTSYEKAISLNSNYVEAYNNLGIVLRELAKLDESEKTLRKAIELNSNFADAYINLSNILYLKDNFKEAFDLSEWRWKTKYTIGQRLISKKPLWDGERNSSVFVWKEQGIGDEIMLCSMIPELKLISKNVIVNCDNRLIPLLSRSLSKDITFVDNKNNLLEKDYSHHISMGSLYRFFRKDLNSFKNSSKGYLISDKESMLELRSKLKDGKKNIKLIGISWHTKSNLQMASFRNILLKDLAISLNKTGVKLINLQYGNFQSELNFLNNETGIEIIDVPKIDKRNDIDGLASLISACDLVVSIDNFTVHLAGSLGIKTKALLPYNMDPRWGLKNSKCFLYDSVEFYRQSRLGNWSDVLIRLKAEL